jgi:hypothetical protein
MNFVENINGLLDRRTQSVRDYVNPLVSDSNNFRLYQRSIGGVAVFGGSNTFRGENDINIRNWRVDSVNNLVKFNYFETWVPLSKGNFFMEKAYLHFYQDDDEIICIHSDPNEPELVHGGYKYREYKQSPHIHFSMIKTDIKKAHVALCSDNLDSCLDNLESFDFSMFYHIDMIKKEIIDRI